MTFVGAASVLVLVLSVGGLILHYRIMKLRTRLDAAIAALDEAIILENEAAAEAEADISQAAEAEADISQADAATPTLQSLTAEYETALAEYEAYTSCFPGNILARILHLP